MDLGFPLTGILPCPGRPPPFPVLGPPFFGTPFAVFGSTLSCRQSSSFLLFAAPNFQSLVTPLVIFWSICAIPLRNIALFALPGSPGQLFFGVVSFWLCAPPPFNWCANVNASFLAKMYDSTAYMHFSLWWSHLASIFVTRFWWHTCHYLIWKRSNVESRKFRLRSF